VLMAVLLIGMANLALTLVAVLQRERAIRATRENGKRENGG